MDYHVKHANPYKLLVAVGFEDNKWGIGMHIIECPKQNGFPARRLHAYVVDKRISMHHDLSLKGRRHITQGNTPEVRYFINYMRALDESFFTCFPQPGFWYRLKAKLSTPLQVWHAIMNISDGRRQSFEGELSH